LHQIRTSLDKQSRTQESGVLKVTGHLGVMSVSLESLASVVEWGLEEVYWAISQQTGVLLHMDRLLRTPTQTQANEKRTIGEELRQRGALKEAEQFLKEARGLYPLDYRTYISLGFTCLQAGRISDARGQFEASLPHAPKAQPAEANEGIADWRSYSLRMIAHTWVCQEAFEQATAALEEAVDLSPTYVAAQYDLAASLARTDRRDQAGGWLESAILGNPMYWYVAQNGALMEPVRDEVKRVTGSLLSRAAEEASTAIDKARDHLALCPVDNEPYRKAQALLDKALKDLESGDYFSVLAIPGLASQVRTEVAESQDQARRDEKQAWIDEQTREAQRKDAMKSGCTTVIVSAFVGAAPGYLLGRVVGGETGGSIGGSIGMVLGGVWGAYIRRQYPQQPNPKA